MTLSEKQIAAYEAKGFNRWTRGSMDRLYINANAYGVTYDRYANGKVSGGEFMGETFGAMEARRFATTKVFVDVKTGELSVTTGTDYEDEIREAVEAIIAEAEASVSEPTIKAETATSVIFTDVTSRRQATIDLGKYGVEDASAIVGKRGACHEKNC